jgi:hypothetical protein
VRVEPGGFTYVVDHRGQLVVFPFQAIAGRPTVVSSWPPVAARLPPEGTTMSFTDQRSGRTWLAGAHPVGGTGWRVVAVQPEAEALQTLRRVFVALGLLVALMSIVAAIGISRWVRLHAFTLQMARQNAKLLKQLNQSRLLDRGKGKG